MSNLNNKFKKILEELEENIEDKKTIEYVKIQMFNLYNMFFEELEKNGELNNKKMLAILSTEQEILDKVSNLETGLKGIEKDIYCDDDECFQVLCPYCNNEFEIDEFEDEITCPECKNKIELDWHHDCDCDDEDCEECNHHCNEEDDI